MTDPNLSLVLDELEKAKRKHPHFVDQFVSSEASAEWFDMEANASRKVLRDAESAGVCQFLHVLSCEWWGAYQAYAHGDLAHARQELAQCAAVCIRGMEYIEDEIDRQNTKQTTTTQGDTTP